MIYLQYLMPYGQKIPIAIGTHQHINTLLILFIMKTLYIILAGILVFLLFFGGCIVNIIGGDPAATAGRDAINRVSTDPPSTLKLIALAALAVYEAVVRIVPSVGDYSAVSWIVKFLKKVSDTLNITKSG